MSTTISQSPFFGGVDPGEYGAIAFYSPSLNALHLMDIRIASSVQRNRCEGLKDYAELASKLGLWLDTYGRPQITLIEKPHSLPHDGHVGAFNFGKSCGMLEGLFHGLGCVQVLTEPGVWKAQMALSSVKAKSIERAKELFKDSKIHHDKNPGMDAFESPKRHADGRAEAALLAYMAATKLGRR